MFCRQPRYGVGAFSTPSSSRTCSENTRGGLPITVLCCGVCSARDGHTVVGVDVDLDKVAAAGSGRSPVIEKGLDELMEQAVTSGRLRATLDGQSAVQESDVSLICVGTPSSGNGSLNLAYIQRVCVEIGNACARRRG